MNEIVSSIVESRIEGRRFGSCGEHQDKYGYTNRPVTKLYPLEGTSTTNIKVPESQHLKSLDPTSEET